MYKQTFLTQEKLEKKRERNKKQTTDTRETKALAEKGVNTKKRESDTRTTRKISYTLLMSVPAPSFCF